MKTAAILSLISLACAGIASAANVTFTSAVATFDQGGQHTVGASINGSLTDTLGWGIFSPTAGQGQTAASQAAVYTASVPFTTNRLQIAIPQYYGGDHYAREFRVSYTSDAVPSLGGAWTPLSAYVGRASRGLTMTNLGPGRYGVSGGVAEGGATQFVVMADGAFSNVTGLRLELLNPGGNIGASGNGNLVITEMLATTDVINIALGANVTTSGPVYPDQFAYLLTDGFLTGQSHPADPPAQTNFSYTVDLNSSFSLSSLEFVNRADCCADRLSNYRVEVLNDAMVSLWTANVRTDGSNSGVGGVDTLTAANGAGTFAGRYVKITNLSGNPYNPQIAEFRAFGSPVPEPGAAVMGLLAAVGVVMRRRR